MENKIKRFISSTVSYHDFARAVEIAREMGVGLEISRFGRLSELDDSFDEKKIEYSKILKDFDNEITLHGFFSNLNITASDPLIREVSTKRYWQSLDLARTFDARTVVFHTGYNNLLKQQSYREGYFLKTIEFFRDFIQEFENSGITATIENVHEATPDLIRNIVAAINSPNLRATLDIGHCNLHSELSPADWIREYGIMLSHMHFHNNYTDEDAHSSLYKGTVNIKEILKCLKDMQLYPTVTFEIFDYDELKESVEYFDKLCDELEIPYA